jgi:hypothetical protein
MIVTTRLEVVMRNVLSTGLVFLVAGCGGVSEERMGALEKQVSAMQSGASAAPDATRIDGIEGRVAALETSQGESLK